MSMAMIVLLPFAAGFGLLYWADQLGEEDTLLRLMFQLMFLPLIFLSIHLAVIDATILYAANTDLISVLGQFTYYLGWLLFAVGVYILFRIMGKIKDMIIQKRQEKEAEKYG